MEAQSTSDEPSPESFHELATEGLSESFTDASRASLPPHAQELSREQEHNNNEEHHTTELADATSQAMVQTSLDVTPDSSLPTPPPPFTEAVSEEENTTSEKNGATPFLVIRNYLRVMSAD